MNVELRSISKITEISTAVRLRIKFQTCLLCKGISTLNSKDGLPGITNQGSLPPFKPSPCVPALFSMNVCARLISLSQVILQFQFSIFDMGTPIGDNCFQGGQAHATSDTHNFPVRIGVKEKIAIWAGKFDIVANIQRMHIA